MRLKWGFVVNYAGAEPSIHRPGRERSLGCSCLHVEWLCVCLLPFVAYCGLPSVLRTNIEMLADVHRVLGHLWVSWKPASWKNCTVHSHPRCSLWCVADPCPSSVLSPQSIEDGIVFMWFRDQVNDSYKHAVPKGSETHFSVTLVTPKFEGVKLIDRHRMVNQVLAEELTSGVHALSITAKTPAQWEAAPIPNSTPKCAGGH
jgi:BolA-like protein 1